MSKSKSVMTPRAASRIQSAAATNQNSSSFVSGFYRRAQSATAKVSGGWPSTADKLSGGGRVNNPSGLKK